MVISGSGRLEAIKCERMTLIKKYLGRSLELFDEGLSGCSDTLAVILPSTEK